MEIILSLLLFRLAPAVDFVGVQVHSQGCGKEESAGGSVLERVGRYPAGYV